MKQRARKSVGNKREEAKAVVAGVSFGSGKEGRDFLDAVKARAKSRRRSVSAYLCDLAHDDLEGVKAA